MGRFALVVAAVTLVVALAAVREVAAKKWTVGENKFWNPNVNYTIWAQDKHFYFDDWLYFVYDRNQHNILEVNKTAYENCISDQPFRNWTRGAGRDLVHLNETRDYYFLSGNGFCYSGMKLAITVEKLPLAPAASPSKSGVRASAAVAGISQFVLPAVVFASAAMWNANQRLW